MLLEPALRGWGRPPESLSSWFRASWAISALVLYTWNSSTRYASLSHIGNLLVSYLHSQTQCSHPHLFTCFGVSGALAAAAWYDARLVWCYVTYVCSSHDGLQALTIHALGLFFLTWYRNAKDFTVPPNILQCSYNDPSR